MHVYIYVQYIIIYSVMQYIIHYIIYVYIADSDVRGRERGRGRMRGRGGNRSACVRVQQCNAVHYTLNSSRQAILFSSGINNM